MLQQKFVQSVINFMENSNINILYPPETPKIEYEDNGKSTVTLSFDDKVFSSEIPNDILLNLTVIFMALDMYVDSKYPHLEGSSFANKLNNFNQQGDEEKILYNIYRIFKLFRNTVTHNISNLNVSNGSITINYVFKSTTFKLLCSEKALDYLFTIVFLYINGQNSSYRKIAFIRSYYNKLIASITSFQDDFSSSLDSIQNLYDNFLFNSLTRRYAIKLSTDYYTVNSNNICFHNQYDIALSEVEKNHTSIDFIIYYSSNKYLIPYESIQNNCIDISDLEKWKV